MGAAAGKIDILLINETKISPYFPKANFIFMGTTNPTNMTIIPQITYIACESLPITFEGLVIKLF